MVENNEKEEEREEEGKNKNLDHDIYRHVLLIVRICRYILSMNLTYQ